MEKKINKKLGHLIVSAAIILFASSAYALSCSSHTTCAGGICSTVTICLNIQ